MSYLRFSPEDYQTISGLCQALDLTSYPLPAFRRLLIASLADRSPKLAGGMAGLGRQQFQLLYSHLRPRPGAERRHDLSTEEVATVAELGLPLLTQARYVRLLKGAIAGRFRESHPDLAAKLERLSLRQFEVLCEQLKEWTGRNG